MRPEQLLNQQQRGCPRHPAVKRTDATGNHHYKQHSGLLPNQQAGTRQPALIRHQGAGQTSQAARYYEDDQAHAENRIAQRFHAFGVFARPLQGVAEW